MMVGWDLKLIPSQKMITESVQFIPTLVAPTLIKSVKSQTIISSLLPLFLFSIR